MTKHRIVIDLAATDGLDARVVGRLARAIDREFPGAMAVTDNIPPRSLVLEVDDEAESADGPIV